MLVQQRGHLPFGHSILEGNIAADAFLLYDIVQLLQQTGDARCLPASSGSSRLTSVGP